MATMQRLAIVIASIVLLAGCTATPPAADEAVPSADVSAPATGGPAPIESIVSTVDGAEFVSVEADEYGVAPDGQQRGPLLDWAAEHCELAGLSPCTGIAERAEQLCVEKWDCHPGVLVPFDQGTAAFLVPSITADPLIIAVWHPEADPEVAPFGGARALLHAFLLSVGACPDDEGADPRGSTCVTVE
jgi:hypothetical protein